MKTHNSVKNLSANSLIASMNTRKIFTVMMCTLLFVSVFTELSSILTYAPEPSFSKTLTPEQKQKVQNALNVLKLTNPNEVGELILTKANNAWEMKDNNGAAYPKDQHYIDPVRGDLAGAIFIRVGVLDDDRNLPGRDMVFNDVLDLLDVEKVRNVFEFRSLVELAELLLHEYTHTQQTYVENVADNNAVKKCYANIIEMEAYWAGITYKLKLKSQLLAKLPADPSPTMLERLDAIDQMVLAELDIIMQRRIYDPNKPNDLKSYEGIRDYTAYPNGSPARNVISNQNLPCGVIQTGTETEPENKDIAALRANLAQQRLDQMVAQRKAYGAIITDKKEEKKKEILPPNKHVTIALPSGSAYAEIPPDSLLNTTEVEISRLNLDGLIMGENALSPVFELGPQVALDPTKPIHLYIRVNDTAFIKNAQVYWWDPYLYRLTVVGWQKILDGREVDEQNGVIHVEIDRFGFYVVILPPIKNPGELVSAIPNAQPMTVDPGVAYDWASGKLIFNVYDTLLTFDGERIDRYIPRIAESWVIEDLPDGTTSPEGLEWFWRYTFKIREGVKWHDPAFGTVAPEDVEFSFERAMVQDKDGGPTWMFYEPLLNTWGAYGIAEDLDMSVDAQMMVGMMIDHAVESNETHVWFNIAFPGAYSPFLQILSQSWASILSKQWINDYIIGHLGRSAWNGEWDDYSKWIDFHNPELSPLDDPTPVMMGTGPFILESLNYTAKQWSVVRFPDYWRGWPADFPSIGSARPAGYVDRFIVTWAYDWATRKDMFLNGDIDFCTVPRQNLNEILGKPGIRCIGPLPSLAVDVLFFNFNIDPTTPYGLIYNYGVFNENGIPRDFFSNVNIRKAFAHSIDYATFIQQSYAGEAMQPPTAIIPSLPYYDATVQKYTYDLAKAKTFFEAVPGLMNTGFNITVTYNSGNTARMNLCNLLKTAIENISPKFHVTVASVTSSAYLYAMNLDQLTCFTLGWLADYPDAHNFAYAFYYTDGNFAWRAGYSNPDMDALIEAGIKTPDGPERATIYSNIQQLAIDTCPSVALDQSLVRHFERDWVIGWYHNPCYPIGTYAYNLWKWYYVPQASFDNATAPEWSNRLPCDVNYDGKVNILDITIVAQAFGSSYGPPIDTRWQFRADIDNNRIINIIDIAAVASYYGITSEHWTPS